VLSIAEVLSDWLLLFYVMGESEGNLRVFGQCEVEERAQSLESTGQDLKSRSTSEGQRHLAPHRKALLSFSCFLRQNRGCSWIWMPSYVATVFSVSVHAQKAFNKIQDPSLATSLRKLRIREEVKGCVFCLSMGSFKPTAHFTFHDRAGCSPPE
jgi:hypothetical protein